MDKFQKWPQRQIAIYAFIVSNKGLSYICKPVMVKKKGKKRKVSRDRFKLGFFFSLPVEEGLKPVSQPSIALWWGPTLQRAHDCLSYVVCCGQVQRAGVVPALWTQAGAVWDWPARYSGRCTSSSLPPSSKSQSQYWVFCVCFIIIIVAAAASDGDAGFKMPIQI